MLLRPAPAGPQRSASAAGSASSGAAGESPAVSLDPELGSPNAVGGACCTKSARKPPRPPSAASPGVLSPFLRRLVSTLTHQRRLAAQPLALPLPRRRGGCGGATVRAAEPKAAVTGLRHAGQKVMHSWSVTSAAKTLPSDRLDVSSRRAPLSNLSQPSHALLASCVCSRRGCSSRRSSKPQQGQWGWHHSSPTAIVLSSAILEHFDTSRTLHASAEDPQELCR